MKVNLLNLIGAFAAAVVCRMTMTGQILNYIQFDDVLGEMFLCALSAMACVILLITSIEKVSK
jgi:hypothetical protein